MLLAADTLPELSIALTKISVRPSDRLRSGNSFVNVTVVCGGLTRTHPPPFRWTQ